MGEAVIETEGFLRCECFRGVRVMLASAGDEVVVNGWFIVSGLGVVCGLDIVSRLGILSRLGIFNGFGIVSGLGGLNGIGLIVSGSLLLVGRAKRLGSLLPITVPTLHCPPGPSSLPDADE